MTRAVSSRSEQADAKKAERLRQKQENEDLAAVLSTAEGRRLVWRFLEVAGPFRTCFNTNAMTMAHSTGWQDAGKWWLSEIERACPERFAQMAAEARKAAKDAAFRATKSEEDDGSE